MIKAKYPRWLNTIQITGDATGASRSPLVRGGLNHYKIIKKELNVLDRNLKVRTKNLSHINSRILCNSIYQNADVRITKNCKDLIADNIYASVDEEGTLVKTAENGLHFCDCGRYMLDACFPKFVERPQDYQ